MTREQAQLVLLKAFVATGELPSEIADLLNILIVAGEQEQQREPPST